MVNSMANTSAEFESQGLQHSAETPLLSPGTEGEAALRAANKKLHDELERLRADLANQQTAMTAERNALPAEQPPQVADASDEDQEQAVDEEGPPAESTGAPEEPMTEGAPKRSDDEESIESYMAALLTRMRGCGAPSSVVAEPSRRRQRKSDTIVQEEPPQTEPPKSESAAEQPPVIASQPAFRDLTPRPRMPVSDLAAMRELANSQARMAIHTHGRKQLLKLVLVRAVTAAGFLVASFVALGLSPFEHEILFGCGMAGLVAGIYWLSLAATDMQKSFAGFDSGDSQPAARATPSQSNQASAAPRKGS